MHIVKQIDIDMGVHKNLALYGMLALIRELTFPDLLIGCFDGITYAQRVVFQYHDIPKKIT